MQRGGSLQKLQKVQSVVTIIKTPRNQIHAIYTISSLWIKTRGRACVFSVILFSINARPLIKLWLITYIKSVLLNIVFASVLFLPYYNLALTIIIIAIIILINSYTAFINFTRGAVLK